MTFIITVAYTGTFANTLYHMLISDLSKRFSLANIEFSLANLLCGAISLIMVMRFFFGNNQYLSEVMQDEERSPWVKFYQFFFIAMESVILLIGSFSIRNQRTFVYVITALFIFEVVWYFLTMLVDRKGVLPDDPKQRWGFFWAEMTNAGFVVGVVGLSLTMDQNGIGWLWGVFGLFLANTVYDVKKNMGSYMKG